MVTPVNTRCVTSSAFSWPCTPVAQNMPLPGLSMTISPGAGASAGMIDVPGSSRIRSRPIAPGSPMRWLGSPRSRLAGGQSERSARCASRVCSTGQPRFRQAASSRWIGPMAVCSSDTSLPSDAPNPPGSTKSRCMSITTNAVLPGGKAYGNGVASSRIMRLVLSVYRGDRRHPCASRSAGGRRRRRGFRRRCGLRSSRRSGRSASAVRRGLR